ncbi:S-adenosyl-L-methionine-dependent methyltransferase [Lineolata rhizophorae]|uniref:S-adenosyl-L-methionine-dependent methyltransferase n=1 Tax=Lineolata rhizophorae TaxID=578093 RepID=A0A6A6P3Q2_9PEZI|nr:S-adenosyl-L-methionine-dependent methyltransferase [Lineolata rhizophorae]
MAGTQGDGSSERPRSVDSTTTTLAADDSVDHESLSDFHSLLSNTGSVKSTIFNYQYENGRRYHAYRAGQYYLPNDEDEQDRLDLVHHVFRLTLGGGLCATELENPQRILDVGTGTGIWAIEMGDEFPESEIIGTDLSPIQPPWAPPNVRFETDDARQEWTFPPDFFDFIHVRCMGGSILNWPEFLERCYKHLKPGGKLEVSEARTNLWSGDGPLPQDSFTAKWLSEFNRIVNSLGLEFDISPALPGFLDSLPFAQVKKMDKQVPITPWSENKTLKEIGRVMEIVMLGSGLSAYTLALFTRNGWKVPDIENLLDKVKEEFREGGMNIGTYFSYVTATKPAVR